MPHAGCRSQSPAHSGRAWVRATHGIALATLLFVAGCEPKPWWNPTTKLGDDHSVTDGTQIAVEALPGWGGGCYWPFVNLWSGNLVLRQVLFDAPALGFDWDLVLYYNSTLAGASTVLGPGWRHSYEMELQIDVPAVGQITALWGDGRADVFTFDGSGWAADPSLHGRRITTIAGDYRLQDKHGLRYEYDSAGRLVRMVDRSGHTTTLTYSLGQLQQVTDASGRTLQFFYDGSGRLQQVQGLPPQPAQFQYDGASRLIRVVHPYVGDHVYAYDGLDRLVRVEDASGRATLYEYWGSTAATKDARADGSVRSFGYDQTTLRTTVSDSVDIATATTTRYTFDAQGRCLAVDGPLGGASNTYSALHQIRFHTDEDGHVTEYQYDALGNLVHVIRPSAATIDWTYDPTFNLPRTVKNELGKTWTYDYDPNGNLTKVTDPLGNFRQYGYDGLDRRISQTDEDTRTTTYAYDAWSNVNRITDPAGGAIQLTRNVRGAVQQVTDQDGNVWQIHRGPQDEVTSVEPPGPFAQYQLFYNAPGFIERLTDPMGAVVRYAYDGLNRVVRREDPYGMPTTIDRDGAGRVKRITDAAGASEDYARDAAGRVVSVLDPDGGLQRFFYGCCDLTQRIDPMGNVATLSYDVDHRMTQVQWPGITEEYAYDAANRLIRAERAAVGEPLIRELYAYDDANRRTQTQQVHLGRTVNYSYSPAGDVLSLADNLQPLPLTIGYDVRHLPTLVNATGVPNLTANYGARRLIQTLAYSGSSLKSVYTYDAVGRLLTATNQSTSFLATYNAAYNARGDREQVTGVSPTYGPYQDLTGHDLKRRVASEQIVPGIATSYLYNSVDDRTQTDPPFGPLYGYSLAHRLQNAGPIIQNWNANGSVMNLTQPGRALNYAYGADGQLTNISSGPQNWHFTHGPGGRLVRVTLPGGIDRWLATDRGPAGVLRRVELPAPLVAPTRERLYAINRGHGGDPSPIAEIRGAHVLANFRGLMSAYDGSIVEAAQANPVGTLEAERYFNHFGIVRWHAGAPQPDVGFRSMTEVAGLDSMWLRTFYVQPNFTFVFPKDGLYIPPTGTLQSDKGLGSDALEGGTGQDPPHPIAPDPSPVPGLPYWVEDLIRWFNFWRNKMIEEGLDAWFPVPPPIDWPPDPPPLFGSGLIDPSPAPNPPPLVPRGWTIAPGCEVDPPAQPPPCEMPGDRSCAPPRTCCGRMPPAIPPQKNP